MSNARELGAATLLDSVLRSAHWFAHWTPSPLCITAHRGFSVSAIGYRISFNINFTSDRLGWYHHVTLLTMAYAFLRLEQARLKKNFWCDLTGSPEEATTLPD
jgi:hypothetical protein